MSASKQKRNRKTDTSALEKKKIAEQEEHKRKKRNKITIAVVSVLIVLIVASAFFINSNYIRRNFTALTIDDMEFSVADFNYYYFSAYYQYYTEIKTNYSEYATSMLPDTTVPFKSQIQNKESGRTWAEYFENMATENMKSVVMLYKEAQANGFELSEDQRQEIEDQIESEKNNAVFAYGYKTFAEYLEGRYGSGMNEKEYIKNIEIQSTASAYSDEVYESFVYTPEELEEYYDSRKSEFDTVTYRYFLVTAEKVEEDDYDNEEDVERAEAANKEVARLEAEALAKQITDEASFIEVARAYDPETYERDDSTLRTYESSILGSYYGPWLRDEARVDGDFTTLEALTGYYVVLFKERDDNHYNTVDVRHILIKPETVLEESYENDQAGYKAAVEAARANAETRAEEIYKEWKDAGATEEKFIELVDNYSNDSAIDGLYEEVYKSQMVTEFNDWCFDPEREPGDHDLIYTTHGYHIMLFVGENGLRSDIIARDKLRETAYEEWVNERLAPMTSSTNWVFALSK